MNGSTRQMGLPTLKIIAAALLGGQLIFAAVVAVLVLQGMVTAQSPMAMPMALVLAGLAVPEVAMWPLIRKGVIAGSQARGAGAGRKQQGLA